MKTLKDNRHLEKTHQLGKTYLLPSFTIEKMDLRNYCQQMDLLVNKSFEKLHVLSFTLKTDLFATEHPHFPEHFHLTITQSSLLPTQWTGLGLGFFNSQLVVRAK